MSDTKCWLKEPPFFMCCCQCVFHVKDYSHPCTDGKKASEFKGYACIGFIIEDRFHPDACIHSGWPEHLCGCEMHQAREKKGEATP